VELGEGIYATCKMSATSAEESADAAPPRAAMKADLSSLGSMLQAKWKGGGAAGPSKPEPARTGQIRSFRIIKLDAAAKKIEVELG
jgi:small subunit ribosomal protein S1